jgi:hypothetical protein
MAQCNSKLITLCKAAQVILDEHTPDFITLYSFCKMHGPTRFEKRKGRDKECIECKNERIAALAEQVTRGPYR